MNHWNSIFIQVILSLLITGNASGQDYFNNSFNPNNTWAIGMSIISNSNSYEMTGINEGSLTGYREIYFSRIDLDGNLILWKSYGSDGMNFWPGSYGSLYQTTDGMYLLGGSISDNNGSVALLMLFNNIGDTLWSETYGDTVNDGNFHAGRDCIQSDEGSFILFGDQNGIQSSDYEDIFLIKTDDVGNEVWKRKYDFNNQSEYGFQLTQVENSGFLLSGLTWIPPDAQSFDPIIIKTDSLGIEQWRLKLGGPYYDHNASICLSDDNKYMIGYTMGDSSFTSGSAYSRINLLKIDTNNSVIWHKSYGPSIPNNYMYNIIPIPGEGYALCGARVRSYGTYYNYLGWILKVDLNGDSLWYREFRHFESESSYNFLYSIDNAADDGFIACGQSYSGQPYNPQSAWLLKVDSIGCDFPNCDSTVWIKQIEGHDYIAVKVYPNPFSSITNFEYNLSHTSYVILQIFNSHGKKVYEIADNQLKGWQSLQWNAEGFPKGIYYYRILSKNLYYSGRVLLVE